MLKIVCAIFAIYATTTFPLGTSGEDEYNLPPNDLNSTDSLLSPSWEDNGENYEEIVDFEEEINQKQIKPTVTLPESIWLLESSNSQYNDKGNVTHLTSATRIRVRRFGSSSRSRASSSSSASAYSASRSRSSSSASAYSASRSSASSYSYSRSRASTHHQSSFRTSSNPFYQRPYQQNRGYNNYYNQQYYNYRRRPNYNYGRSPNYNYGRRPNYNYGRSPNYNYGRRPNYNYQRPRQNYNYNNRRGCSTRFFGFRFRYC